MYTTFLIFSLALDFDLGGPQQANLSCTTADRLSHSGLGVPCSVKQVFPSQVLSYHSLARRPLKNLEPNWQKFDLSQVFGTTLKISTAPKSSALSTCQNPRTSLQRCQRLLYAVAVGDSAASHARSKKRALLQSNAFITALRIKDPQR